MQKPFYYKLFKRLGLFPNATFSDTEETIDFPTEGGVSSINSKNGDFTFIGDVANGIELSESGNTFRFIGGKNFYCTTGSATISGGSYYNPSTVQSSGTTNDPTASGTKMFSRVWTPPTAAGFYRVRLILDQPPGTGETVTISVNLNGNTIGTLYNFGDSEDDVSSFFSYNVNSGDLVALNITKSAGAATTSVYWHLTFFYNDPLYS